MVRSLIFRIIPVLLLFLGDGNLFADPAGWRAGIARIKITPEEPMWMAGYASRTNPSTGIIHDLWAKALVIKDSEGHQAVLVTTDLLGFPKSLSERICQGLKTKYGFDRSRIILSSSHTHSGPVLENALYDIYPFGKDEIAKIESYSSKLENQIISLVGDAVRTMKPARLLAGSGVTRFQVNRRNNLEPNMYRQTSLNGPNDYAVPVIKVEDESGKMIAVAFGYACHPTVLSGNEWSGDYPGFTQIEIEKMYPGTTAMFFQGTGADMNPLPRRTVPLALQYGRELAAAVDRVLNEEMRILPSRLSTAYSEVNLGINDPPGDEELQKIIMSGSSYQKKWATRIMSEKKQGNKLLSYYPYPVQVWLLGDQPIVVLGGEVVIDYTIQLKRILGQEIFVMGYSNDVMSYIPSARVLQEGGYEGAQSQMVYGLPGTWKPDIETKILEEVYKLARQARVPIPERALIDN